MTLPSAIKQTKTAPNLCGEIIADARRLPAGAEYNILCIDRL
jgi:hypothetical protein